MNEHAEAIARVIRDISAGNIAIHTSQRDDDGMRILNTSTMVTAPKADVIDATPMFERWMALGNQGRLIYEEHRVRPPWDTALIGYENSYGNVTVMSLRSADLTEDLGDGFVYDRWESLSDTHDIDWDRVRWVIHVVVYMGGRSSGPGDPKPILTQGPLHLWRIAVYPDGEIADLNWVTVRPDIPTELWDSPMMVLLDTLNLCNCVNVHIAEPERPRAAAKRLARLGVRVSELHIRPVSKSYRGKGTPLSRLAMPLHSVRGHMATYGSDGRGLLFGKYAGRFWIPPHARGSEHVGTVEHVHTAEP